MSINASQQNVISCHWSSGECRFRREALPIYQCCFLDENEKTVRTQVLGARDYADAHREAMTLMTRVGRFSGFELWAEGRKVDEYRLVKEG
jgi:hypothetical protein